MSTKPVRVNEPGSEANAATVDQQVATVDQDVANTNPKPAPIDMKFEIVVIPVSNVDRAKDFYAKLGWRLDADYAHDDDFRVLQFTPPGSGCSVIFGKNV